MTDWEHHHPPSDHPDFDAYLDTLTEDDLTAIETATNITPKTHNGEPDTPSHPRTPPADSRNDF